MRVDGPLGFPYSQTPRGDGNNHVARWGMTPIFLKGRFEAGVSFAFGSRSHDQMLKKEESKVFSEEGTNAVIAALQAQRRDHIRDKELVVRFYKKATKSDTWPVKRRARCSIKFQCSSARSHVSGK